MKVSSARETALREVHGTDEFLDATGLRRRVDHGRGQPSIRPIPPVGSSVRPAVAGSSSRSDVAPTLDTQPWRSHGTRARSRGDDYRAVDPPTRPGGQEIGDVHGGLAPNTPMPAGHSTVPQGLAARSGPDTQPGYALGVKATGGSCLTRLVGASGGRTPAGWWGTMRRHYGAPPLATCPRPAPAQRRMSPVQRIGPTCPAACCCGLRSAADDPTRVS
jgi:hypothetical protein